MEKSVELEFLPAGLYCFVPGLNITEGKTAADAGTYLF